MRQSIKQRTCHCLWEAGRSISRSLLGDFTLAHVVAPLQPIAVERQSLKGATSASCHWLDGAQDVSCPVLQFTSFEQRASFPELPRQSGNGRVSFRTGGPSCDITQAYFIHFLLWFHKTNTERHLSAQQNMTFNCRSAILYFKSICLSSLTDRHASWPNESHDAFMQCETAKQYICCGKTRHLDLFQSFYCFKTWTVIISSCPILEFSPMQWLYRGVYC